jgi:hypothetical protein
MDLARSRFLPARQRPQHPRNNVIRRHHLHENIVQKRFKKAAKMVDIAYCSTEGWSIQNRLAVHLQPPGHSSELNLPVRPTRL